MSTQGCDRMVVGFTTTYAINSMPIITSTGCDRMVVGFTTTYAINLMPIITSTDVVCSNVDQGEVYNIM